MPGIITKRIPTRDELLEWLARRPNRLTELAARRDFDPWQNHLRDNEAKFIHLHKSRRAGGSWVVMDKVFIRSQLRPGYSCQAISTRQKDAEGLIDYVREVHDNLPPRFKRPTGSSDSKTEIAFNHPNGRRSVISAYPNKAPRSKGGDVVLDEFAHGRDDRKIFIGALPCVSLNPEDQLIELSTGFAKSGVHYDIHRRADGKYTTWFFYNIPWWFCPRLCADVEAARIEAPLMTTRERVERFGTQSLKEIFDSFPDIEAFQVEYELEFLEAVSALFSPEMLERLCVADWGDYPESELTCRVVEDEPSELDWMWLRANRKGVFFGGYDVGRKRHESDLWIWDIDGDRKEVRMIVRLYKKPFRLQESVLKAALTKSDVVRTCIDQTGMGMQLAENLIKDHPGRFEGITFTQQTKDMMATRVYIAAIADPRELYMPRYRPLILHFVSIRKEAGPGGQVRYSVNLNEQQEVSHHHADLFWSAALGLEAANIKIARGGLVKLGDVGP